MRIERVVARAFGPFQNEVLELGTGLSVVAGPNESGKSTWHAALRLAITGVRRGKGPGTLVERQLAERHRPWDLPDRWEVEARLGLDDGRTIDISQDLAGKVACRAVDVALGRDVSDEIMDGTPDASRWLGLDRDSFAATVSVGQSQILAVADAAEGLQEQMQRAAATRGSDATAAEAIARLEEFRRDAVGADTVAAKGPLRTAKNRLAAAEATLAEARRQHADYLDRSSAVEELELRAGEAGQRLAGAEAAHARMLADEAAARVARASELAARYPSQPPSLAARDEQADRVAAALEAWAGRPELPVLNDRTAAAISAEIAGLPSAPVGDTRPHTSVTEAVRAVDLAYESAAIARRAAAGAGQRRFRGRGARTARAGPAPPHTPAVAAARAGLRGPIGAEAEPQPLEDCLRRGRARAAGRHHPVRRRLAHSSGHAAGHRPGGRRRRRAAAHGGDSEVSAPNRDSDAALSAYRLAVADAERDRRRPLPRPPDVACAADPACHRRFRRSNGRGRRPGCPRLGMGCAPGNPAVRQAAAIAHLRVALSDRGVALADAEDPRPAAMPIKPPAKHEPSRKRSPRVGEIPCAPSSPAGRRRKPRASRRSPGMNPP